MRIDPDAGFFIPTPHSQPSHFKNMSMKTEKPGNIKSSETLPLPVALFLCSDHLNS